VRRQRQQQQQQQQQQHQHQPAWSAAFLPSQACVSASCATLLRLMVIWIYLPFMGLWLPRVPV
jgi:hypothetical protein